MKVQEKVISLLFLHILTSVYSVQNTVWFQWPRVHTCGCGFNCIKWLALLKCQTKHVKHDPDIHK